MLIFITNVLKRYRSIIVMSKKNILFNEFNVFKNILNALLEIDGEEIEDCDFKHIINDFSSRDRVIFINLYKVNKALQIFDVVTKWSIPIDKAIRLYDFVEGIFPIKAVIKQLSSIPIKNSWDQENQMLLNYKFKEFQKNLLKSYRCMRKRFKCL